MSPTFTITETNFKFIMACQCLHRRIPPFPPSSPTAKISTPTHMTISRGIYRFSTSPLIPSHLHLPSYHNHHHRISPPNSIIPLRYSYIHASKVVTCISANPPLPQSPPLTETGNL
ncbi:hypothetical protein EX30DRAFT_223074 [Ascodesmis nigricans]|uniref:Uncharacterized protein n=1 Tax=Ascodesmis nigricans TaxID=341454 RepID=A0A4S2MP16_9PEZI|nr:hypothetical protein EX30DRAFT_223074 [Ascodesmis nigricans]